VLGGDAPLERVAVSLDVTVPLFELVGVVVGEPERVRDDDVVPDRVGVKVVLVEAPKDIVGVPDDDGEGDAATTPITINGAGFAEPGVLIRLHVIPEPVQSV
jgi:hypothetical protein